MATLVLGAVGSAVVRAEDDSREARGAEHSVSCGPSAAGQIHKNLAGYRPSRETASRPATKARPGEGRPSLRMRAPFPCHPVRNVGSETS